MIQHTKNQLLLIFFISVVLYCLYQLTSILTPFLLGALIAYLANPVIKRLSHHHVPHLLSVIVVFLLILGLMLFILFMLLPMLYSQLSALVNTTPQIIAWLQESAVPWLKQYINIAALKATVSQNASQNSAWLLNTVLHSSHTVIDFIVQFALTIVVTFYLLRDWDHILAAGSNILPKSIKPTVLKLIKQCDEVLSAFFRGQLLVMISLCLVYSIGLTLVGLEVGPMLGIIGGMLSIVPYLGSFFILTTASLTALVQFSSWQPVLWVVLVFLLGQGLEGYVLVPYLIGNRIGLHPVAIIFAVLAGGTLFGFFGILVALPVAAVIMVLLRFIRGRYELN